MEKYFDLTQKINKTGSNKIKSMITFIVLLLIVKSIPVKGIANSRLVFILLPIVVTLLWLIVTLRFDLVTFIYWRSCLLDPVSLYLCYVYNRWFIDYSNYNYFMCDFTTGMRDIFAKKYIGNKIDKSKGRDFIIWMGKESVFIGNNKSSMTVESDDGKIRGYE